MVEVLHPRRQAGRKLAVDGPADSGKPRRRATIMATNQDDGIKDFAPLFYRLDTAERRRMMADAGFVRQLSRVWSHPDGRSIGEAVLLSLADEPFLRFLRLPLPEIEVWEDPSSRGDRPLPPDSSD